MGVKLKGSRLPSWGGCAGEAVGLVYILIISHLVTFSPLVSLHSVLFLLIQKILQKQMFYVKPSLKPICASSNKREQSQGLGVGIKHLCTFKLLLPFLFDTSVIVHPHVYHVVSCLLLSSWPILPTFSWLTQTSYS